MCYPLQINHLAELVIDKSQPVREELSKFLYVLLTEIGDRYDHHTRLLPYVLDLLTDESASVANVALATLQKCGKEYESEHEDEIRDRLQYGVDGDDRINLEKPLPAPFVERPRLGMRLYIRGTSKRFLTALVNELTNWVSSTRIKSAQLLKMLVILCEEHLTMEAHTLFPAFIKALKFAHDDKDTALKGVLTELFELLGRYILPEVYVYYILPRLRGDAEVVAFGVDATTRIVVMEFLAALLSGSKPTIIVPHLDELVTTLTDPFVVPLDSPQLQSAATSLLLGIFTAVRGKGTKVIEAHYVATGRLSSLKGTVRRAFRFLLLQLSFPLLAHKAHAALLALSELEADHGQGIVFLYRQHTSALLQEAISDYEVDSLWSPSSCAEHMLIGRLLQPPAVAGFPVHEDALTFLQLLEFLASIPRKATDMELAPEVENSLFLSTSELVIVALHPIVTSKHLSGNSEANKVITAKANTLLDSFVYDQRYLRTSNLLTQSLRILSILLRSPLEVTLKEDHLSKLLQWASEENVTKDDVDDVHNAINHANVRGETLLCHMNRILNTTLGSAMVPAIPAFQRAEALTLADHAILMLRADCGRTKLKSFAHHEKTNPLPGMGDTVPDSTLKVLAGKLSVQQGLAHLLCGLNDSDDTVRNTCVQVLSSAVPFILSSSEISHLHADDRLVPTVCAMITILPNKAMESVVDFTCIVSTLLKQVLLPGVHANAEYMAYLNDTLRTVCVLDPAFFEAIVRAELGHRLAPLTASQPSSSAAATSVDDSVIDNIISLEDLNSFVSGLLSHVEILQQFQ